MSIERRETDAYAERRRRENLEMAAARGRTVPDLVNAPPHYRAHPSGVECIEITEHMGFCLGNAVKYIWRAGLKGDAVEDLRKARFYIDREIDRLERRLQHPHSEDAGQPWPSVDSGAEGGL